MERTLPQQGDALFLAGGVAGVVDGGDGDDQLAPSAAPARRRVSSTASSSDSTAAAARTRLRGAACAPTTHASRGQRAVTTIASRWRLEALIRSAGGRVSGVWSLGRQDSVSSSSASSR